MGDRTRPPAVGLVKSCPVLYVPLWLFSATFMPVKRGVQSYVPLRTDDDGYTSVMFCRGEARPGDVSPNVAPLRDCTLVHGRFGSGEWSVEPRSVKSRRGGMDFG